MAEKVYYDENILYLDESIKKLQQGCSIDLDFELYGEKFIEDLLFTQTTLTNLYVTLMSSSRLIRRLEYLKLLSHSKSLYVDLLISVLDGGTHFTSEMKPFYSRLREYLTEQREHIHEIRTLLISSGQNQLESQDIVSQEEFKFLLMEDRNSGEPA